MNNLYVYAIGGTGERIMKSLVIMMAAGVKLGANKVIPIFIDNDAESKALTDCKELIDSYRNEEYGFHRVCTQFNGVSFAQTEIAEPTILDRAGGAIGNLSRMINVPILDEADVEIETGAEDVLAQQTILMSLLDGDVQTFHSDGILGTDIDVTLGCADGIAGDGHGL